MGMFHRFPQTMQAVVACRESFHTGLGNDYDSHGPEGAVGIERSFEPWNRTFLLPVVLPALDGVVAKLEAGATVADIGCGAGGALIMMAKAFPASTFHGYDISQYALARAEEKKAEAGIANVHFHDPRVEPLPADGSRRSGDDVRLHPRHDPPAGDDRHHPRGDRRRRHLAARRHQGARHLRRERPQEPDGRR